MNKGELISALAERHGLKQKEAAGFIEQFFGAIMGALAADGRVEIRGFGSFKMKEYKGYTGRNPKSGAEVRVQPKRLPFFRMGKELKDFINE